MGDAVKLTGWGVMVWFLSPRVYDHAPRAVRLAVLAGLCAWFLVDTAGSIASGNASNALFNVMVLGLAAGPLWFPPRGEHDAAAVRAQGSAGPQESVGVNAMNREGARP